MQALSFLAPVGAVLLKMAMGLLTEAFIKKAVVIGLEKLVKKTENQEDDRLLSEAKKAWNMEQLQCL